MPTKSPRHFEKHMKKSDCMANSWRCWVSCLSTTGTGFLVTPVVALLRPGFSLQVDPEEVADVFEIPLAHLMSPVNHRWHSIDMGGVEREFLSMPWQSAGASGRQQNYLVWGATAAMLRNLYRFLLA